MIREYRPLKMPNGMSDGLMFSRSTGRQLDIFGEYEGLKRRNLSCIKEPDFLYKIRLRNSAIKGK